MLKNKSIFKFHYLAFILVGMIACNNPIAQKKEKLIIRVSSDANSLNPLKARGETSSYVCMQVFQTLIAFDYESNNAIGVIAESMPLETKLDSNITSYKYLLRKGAAFDSIHPITPADILFSFKLAIAPGIAPKGSAGYYQFIDSLIIEERKPNEITMLTHGNYFLNKYFTGDFYILPKHIYDPSGILDAYSISELRNVNLAEDSILQSLSTSFNDVKFEKNKEFIKGSGPYQIKDWQTNQRIILERKENWWGKSYQNQSTCFDQNTALIQYEIITDNATALAALKSGKIDLIKGLIAKDFKELENNTKIKTASAVKSNYDYLAYNCHHPFLKDKALRKAIAHLVNKDELVENIYYQAAEKTSSPIPSSQKSLINTTLTEYPFSMDSARHILQEENWKDSNGDGILDKVVDGNQTDFSITYVYNTNDEFRKSFGILLQNRAKSVGIDIRIDGVDWSNYLQRLRSGDFDLLYGSKGNPPIPPDLFANFHSSNANGGRNYTNYKSLKSDSLMEAIRLSNSDAERKELYMHLQAEIHQDLPVLFLVEPHETFVYSNQLEQVHISPIRPNYWAPSIKIKE